MGLVNPLVKSEATAVEKSAVWERVMRKMRGTRRAGQIYLTTTTSASTEVIIIACESDAIPGTAG